MRNEERCSYHLTSDRRVRFAVRQTVHEKFLIRGSKVGLGETKWIVNVFFRSMTAYELLSYVSVEIIPQCTVVTAS